MTQKKTMRERMIEAWKELGFKVIEDGNKVTVSFRHGKYTAIHYYAPDGNSIIKTDPSGLFNKEEP